MKIINILPITSVRGSVDFHVWKNDKGEWYSCRSGNYRGTISESDDLGPFDTEEDALEAQQDDWKEHLRN